jgi:ABC-type glutathione transport system ATPase component
MPERDSNGNGAAVASGAAAVAAAQLLKVEDLRVSVPTDEGRQEMVHGVSFGLERGRSLGLVGESGSGKTLTCRAVLGILPPGVNQSGGAIEFDGESLAAFDERRWRRIRSVRVGAVFQDPASYLNPSLSAGRQLSEVLRVKGGLGRRESHRRAVELFEAVGLREADRVYHQIPSHLSGGMQQRVMMAIAISCDPDLLVADEPTTALDVKTQGEILALLRELRERLGLAVLFVSHDLDVIAEICDDVAVFHRGRIVEAGPTEAILAAPRHEHTRDLVAASAVSHRWRREEMVEVIDG